MHAAVAESPPHAGVEIDLGLLPGTLETLAALQARHGDIFRVAAPTTSAATYVVAHPDLAAEVFTTRHADYRRFILDGRSELVLGQGLLISEGETWKAQRKLLQRCFHGAALIGRRDAMAACSARLCERWLAAADAGLPVELTADTLEASLDFNLRAMFSDDAGALHAELGADFLQRLTAAEREDTRSNLLFLKRARQARASIAALAGERRRRSAPGNDLLGLMLAARHRGAGGGMSENLLVDEVLGILTAGHETVAAALKFAWYEIARDPALMAALCGEADRVLGHAAPATACLEGLRLTRQVLLETMRLHPPIWVVARQALVDTRIGEWAVPAGSNVLVCTWLIHRHPAFWPKPEVFDPGRFAAAAVAERHAHAYLAFSKGPRHCIGDELALEEMLLHVATVARAARLALRSGRPGRFAGSFLLRSPAPIHVEVARRGAA